MFIITPYDTYINQFYKKNSGLNKKSYVTQKKAIDQDCFAWCGVWDKPFEKLGFKTMSVYPNCRDLQQTWALENTNKNLDISLILEKQISFFKPDILMTDNVSIYDDNWIINLKIKFPFIKKIIGHICSSIYSPEKIKKYDHILTCLESIKRKIIRHNKNVFIDTKKKLGKWINSATYIKINDLEYKNSFETIGDVLKDRLIITQGRHGCIYNDEVFPVDEVSVKDVSGAGDSFLAALTVNYLETNDIREAIKFAQNCATLVVQEHGVVTV